MAPSPTPSTALTVPEDVLKDLLKHQQEGVTVSQLPRIKVMGQGAGTFEFPDDDPKREFRGVILGARLRNVLWTRKMDPNEASEGEEARPDCSSRDGGHYGIPKHGFVHAALGRAAIQHEDGTGDRILCRTCPYNKFGSGATFIEDKNPKGKAVTNQKVLYVLVEGRKLPFELVLSSTSINTYDDYVTRLSNKGLPVQALYSRFTQRIEQKGRIKYGIVVLQEDAQLGSDAFNYAIEQYQATLPKMRPPHDAPVVDGGTVDATDVEVEELPPEGKATDDIPF